MRLDNLKRTMHQFGRETVDLIKRDIRYKDAIRTGKLLGSITYQLYERSGNIEVDFFMIDYGKYVDEGTIYIKARRFFKQNIEDQYKKWQDEFADALSKDALAEIENILK
jgi:hypothetical protein